MIENNLELGAAGYYRNRLPSKYLERLGHKVDTLPITEFNYDLVVFNRFYNITFEYILNACRQCNSKIVFETDDLISDIETKNPFYYAKTQNFHDSHINLLKESDLVTVTVPILKDEISKITKKPISVLPNCLDFELWGKRLGNNKTLRIGYSGGTNHYTDFEFILDLIIELQKKYDFTFVTLGIGHIPKIYEIMKEIDESDKPKTQFYWSMVRCLEKIKQVKNYENTDFVSVMEYPKKMRDLNLDIGLAYIIDTKFNRCKSALKFYEYAACNTVTLASNIPPYEGECNYTAKNKFRYWYSKLEQLITNQKIREMLTESQHDWVINNRDISKNINLWEDAYLSVLPQKVGV